MENNNYFTQTQYLPQFILPEKSIYIVVSIAKEFKNLPETCKKITKNVITAPQIAQHFHNTQYQQKQRDILHIFSHICTKPQVAAEERKGRFSRQ